MRILLAIDGSSYSEAALQSVIAERRPADGPVRVVCVLQPILATPPPQMASGYAPELEEESVRARELVEQAAKRLEQAGFEVDGVVTKGDIRETILDLAEEWKADLIVMGSHGYGPIRRVLLGSVAEFVARHAECSVEIVRAAA